MMSFVAFYGLCSAAGGNDIIAMSELRSSIDHLTYFSVTVLLGPFLRVHRHQATVHLPCSVSERCCTARPHHHPLRDGGCLRSTCRYLPPRAMTMTARDREPDPLTLSP